MFKKIIIVIVAALIALGGYLIFAKDDNLDRNNLKKASIVEEIKKVDGQLFDVRTPEEYSTLHAKGAVNLPVEDILADRYSNIDKTRPVYLYCRTGRRAEQAREKLLDSGYSKVINLGGLDDWQSRGGQTCKSNSEDC